MHPEGFWEWKLNFGFLTRVCALLFYFYVPCEIEFNYKKKLFSYLLISPIWTISFTIATPLSGYAVLFRALELFNWITICGCTFSLIAVREKKKVILFLMSSLQVFLFFFLPSITTIIVAIANPSALYTTSIVASELIGATSFIYNESEITVCENESRGDKIDRRQRKVVFVCEWEKVDKNTTIPSFNSIKMFIERNHWGFLNIEN